MTLQNAFGDLALDATLAATNTKLDSILTELGTKLDGGGTVALDSASLAALESISASVSNWPGDFPDSAVLTKLETIRLLLASGIVVTGDVHVSGTAAAGATVADSPVPVGGVDGSNHVQHLKVAPDGTLYITQSGITDGTQKTQIVSSGGTSAAISSDGSVSVSDQTAKDLVHLLNLIASRLGTNDGLGKMLVNVGNATLAVTQSGTFTVTPANTANTTAWLFNSPAAGFNTGGYGTGLDQHYQSASAYAEAIRNKIQVT